MNTLTIKLSAAGVAVLLAAIYVGRQSPTVTIGIVLAIPVILAVVASAIFRFVLVVVGALIVFQAAANGPKYVYLAAAVLCFVVSAMSLRRAGAAEARLAKPFILMAGVLGIVVLLSGAVAHVNQTSTSTWFRDALAYLLLVILPVVGLDAGRRLTRDTIDRLIVILGVIAAVGFATDWLNRRGVSSLGVGRFVLATPTLAALGFTHALVMAARRGTRTVVWMLAAVVIAVLLIVTGTRTNLVLIVVFPAIVGAGWKGRVPLGRLVSLLVPVVILTVLAIPFIGARLINDPTFLQGRLNAALSVLHGGAASDDQSLLIRQQSYLWAHEQFDLGRWIGTGPGHAYPDGSFSLDTPWLVPAKFGIIGTALILLYFVVTAHTVVRSRQLVGYQYAGTTVRGFVVFLVFLTPFGPWPEDKGTALAVTLVMAMMIAYTREPVEMPSPVFFARKGRSSLTPLRPPATALAS